MHKPEPLYHAIQNMEEQLLSAMLLRAIYTNSSYMLYYNVICVTTEQEFLELRCETHEDIRWETNSIMVG